jgi:uncharacterized protein YbjT (DUF2867 family)
VQATQFFEFLKQLADISFDGTKVRLPDALFQPMAADDVATAVGQIAVGPPFKQHVEIAGPELFRIDKLVRRRLTPLNDSVRLSPIQTPGTLVPKLDERTLVPGKDAQLGETRFETWLTQPAAKAAAGAPQVKLLREPVFLDPASTTPYKRKVNS